MTRILVSGIFLVLSVSSVFCIPSRIVDGKIKYAIATINGEIAWDEAEKQSLVNKFEELGGTTTVTTVNMLPTAAEIGVSTNVLSFKNHSDYISCLTKSGLFQKIKILKDEYDFAVEINDDDKKNELKKKYEYMLQIYAT